MTASDIALRHATLHTQRTFLAPGEQFKGLTAQIEEAILDSQELLNDSTLARELKQACKDRDSWQQAYMDRTDDFRRMTAARDDATAAHLITAQRLQAAEIELGEAKKLLGL